MPSTQPSDQDAPNLGSSRLLDRRLAAAHVGLTIGLFERLVREQVIPEPVVIDRRPLWSARLLDGCVEAITRARGLQTTDASRPEAAQSANSGPGHSAANEAAILPDEEWLERRADLVRRIRKSPLSQHELSMLHEFNLLQGREASMFGFYRTFEALMARGLVVEVSRSGPVSRPLVTYRLTDAGAKIAGSMKDSKV
jgi:hypothetical protein